MLPHLLLTVVGLTCTACVGQHMQGPPSLTDAFLENVLQRYEMQKDYPDAPDYMDFMERTLRQRPAYDEPAAAAAAAAAEDGPGAADYAMLDFDYKQAAPSIRDHEFLQHSSLWGNQYVAGGAGEGTQRLRPEGSIKNQQVTKTDGVLPAYCEPPNPCPRGYTASDGCLETFENTAAFSRRYQARQQCMCDTEHMFNCPDSTNDSEISALARSISNKGIDDSTIQNMLVEADKGNSKVVAKKFHPSRRENPYLTGDRLPVAAKKG